MHIHESGRVGWMSWPRVSPDWRHSCRQREQRIFHLASDSGRSAGRIETEDLPGHDAGLIPENNPHTRRAATSALRTAPSVFAQST